MFNTIYANSVGFSPAAIVGFTIIGSLVFLLVLVLKGYSLWYAAKRNEKWWFIIILVVNTIGILELIYLYFVVQKWHRSKTQESQAPLVPNQNP